MSNNSNLLKIQILEKEYNGMLAEHEQVHQTYVQNLIAQKTEEQNSYEYKPNSTYWGTTSLDSIDDINTAEECEIQCSSNKNCTGATFNDTQKHCWTRGGYGQITSGTSHDTAIVSDIVESARQLRNLNEKIEKIKYKLNQLRSPFYEKYNMYHKKVDDMGQNVDKYDKLLKKEKYNLKKMEAKYGTLEEMDQDSLLYTTQQHWWLTIWFLIAMVFIIFVLFQIQTIPIYANTVNTSIYFVGTACVILLSVILMKKIKKS